MEETIKYGDTIQDILNVYTAGREENNGRKTITKEKVEKIQAMKESHSCDEKGPSVLGNINEKINT